MQFLWKYIDDLMGKGLELEIILELLLYACADLVPLALPLSILLSSIMVFGKFGEQNELTAAKSAGLSLFRIFRPLTVIVLCLSIGSFFFSNYAWPSAHFKMRVLIGDITTKKTTLALKEGEYYNDIPGYSIKVEKKLDPSHFERVYISDHSRNGEHSRIWREIYAERADLKKSADATVLLVTLYDGFVDEELKPQSTGDIRNPFLHTEFKKLRIMMDLSEFKLRRTEMEGYQEVILFKTFKQLTEDVDSLKEEVELHEARSAQVVRNKLFYFRDSTPVDYANLTPIPISLKELDPQRRKNVLTIASTNVRQSKIDVESKLNTDIGHLNMTIVYVELARNRVFILSIVIIILFFIGAPLGAIAKKGGIGYPVLFATIFFLLYYILSITGEKMARNDAISPFLGMWLSSLILTPIAIFLSYKANSDSVLFDKDFYKKLFRRRRK